MASKFANIIEGVNDFSRRFMGNNNSNKNEANIVTSPIGLWTVLAIANAGANGTSQQDILNIILRENPTEADINNKYNGLMQQIISDSFKSANIVYVHPSLNLTETFKNTVQTSYQGACKALASDPRQSVDEINQFISSQTNQKIQNAVDGTIIQANVRCLLINTVYYKSNWATAFDKSNTKSEPFTNSNGAINVNMMNVESDFRVIRNNNVQQIELPYDGSKYSMIISIPTSNNPEAFMQMIKSCDMKFTELQNAPKSKVALKLPRFCANWKADIVPILTQLGSSVAFSGNGDYSNLSSDSSVQINSIIHIAVVEVNEDGSEAGAGTIAKAVAKVVGGGADTFAVNRPFSFYIKHNETNTIVFNGAITNPNQNNFV